MSYRPFGVLVMGIFMIVFVLVNFGHYEYQNCNKFLRAYSGYWVAMVGFT
ncbi:MAG: hypothetical protein QXO71_02850 [Candidatus Jordarchaeaceae archaeon]